MPWKTENKEQARRRFIEEWMGRKRKGESIEELCSRYGISRSRGYYWWERFKKGGVRGLKETSRKPQVAVRLRDLWFARLQLALKQDGDFGPKKLRWKLRIDYPRARVPCVRTLSRWLERWGKVKRKTRRSKPGPQLRLKGRLKGRYVNDVWTIDLKGQFRTTDTQVVHALTVRDVASRYVLCVQHVRRPNEVYIGAVMLRLFRRYGLPKAIRSDNGAPFGGGGPRGWSGLSASWVKLGIRMEYGRPRCPQDNAAHEQMHGELKKFAATPVSINPVAQQLRFERWRNRYNQRRPHEALGMRVPAERYHPSPRILPASVPDWIYPKTWLSINLDGKGRCFWRDRQRLIGKAFIGETLAARLIKQDVLAVYFGPHLLGHLYADDPAGLRHAHWRQPLTPQRGSGSAPPTPTPIF